MIGWEGGGGGRITGDLGWDTWHVLMARVENTCSVHSNDTTMEKKPSRNWQVHEVENCRISEIKRILKLIRS